MRTGVALLGRAGSGKTTLADALVEAKVMDARHSFAAALKRDLNKLGVKKDQPYARDVMIAYGQNRRAVSTDWWIERLRFDLFGEFAGVVIDDVRFPNELAFLRDQGFLVVRLIAPPLERMKRGIPAEFANGDEPSEVACDHLPSDLVLDTHRLTVDECIREVADALAGVPA